MEHWLDIVIAPAKAEINLRVNIDITGQMFRLFGGVYHRWNSLEIDLSPTLCVELNSLLEATRDDPLRLRSLTFRFTDVAPPVEILVRTLSKCPYLEKLSWICALGKGRVPLLTIPCQRLKVVRVAHVATVNDYINFLSLCTAAERVKLLNWVAFPDKEQDLPSSPMNIPPVTLSSLTSLSLSRGTDPIILLQQFTFPSLRFLSIGVRHRDHVAFSAFLKHSPRLETLIIDESWRQDAEVASDEDLVAYLRNPYIRRVPHVQLCCTDASIRGLGIVEQHKDLFCNTQPSLSCWTECFTEDPESLEGHNSAPIAFLGWKGGSDANPKVTWHIQDGKVEFNWKVISLGLSA